MTEPLETESLSGSLSPGVVGNLLEYLKQTRADGRLVLYGEAEEGHIYLQSGEVTSTVLGRLDGDEALSRLLGWQDGRFEYQPESADPQGIGQTGIAEGVIWQEDSPAGSGVGLLPEEFLEALSLTARRLLGPIGEIFLQDAAEDLGYDDDTAVMSKDAEALIEMMASYMDTQPQRQFLSAARALLRQHGL